MAPWINKTREKCWLKRSGTILVIAVVAALLRLNLSAAETVKQRTFASPEEAVKAMVESLKSNDAKALEEIFGPGSKALASSGDPVADRAEYEGFVKLCTEKSKVQEESSEKAVLYVGNQDWPFPIPIVKKDGLWHFDAREGKKEILARRIGKNELSAIQFCLAYVDAQREYFLKDRDGDNLLEYAQKLASDKGRKNGLYWEAKAGDEQSPLGELAARAQKQGYSSRRDKPQPLFGYYYRILTGQGKNAADGAYDYRVKGNMIGGFALVAYPAKYGASGFMTFIVNQDGVVYQKDLGRNTEKASQAMKLFDPDGTWKRVEEEGLKPKG